jgi:two-component system, sensor histidine kinase
MTIDEQRRRLGVAQVEALFGSILIATATASATSLFIAAGLISLGYVALGRGLAWVLYLHVLGVCNLALRRFYLQSRPVGDRWRAWAIAFTAINCAVGVGFGWATVGLTTAGGVEAELAVLFATLCTAAGAIPPFSPYLPAFLFFLLPTTVPFAVASFLSTDPLVHRLGPISMLVFIGGTGGLGQRANGSFAQLVGLRIQAEELAMDLERQKDIAEQANRAKSMFLAAASHDLRQPVHALGLFVGALRGVAMAPEGRRMLAQIEASITAMNGLFSALLDVSRLDAGVVTVERRPFAIQSVVDRVSRDFVGEADTKGVSLVWKACAAVVDSDPVLVERILRNLVSNAVRYTERGRIVIGCRRRGQEIAIQVWDTGVGIPEHQRALVFQEYYQLGNPERDRSKGLGLGLAIVRRLADLLGCPLTLRSNPGKGSCFEVVMPLAAENTGVREPSPVEPKLAAVTRFVVVIDDEQAVREATSSLLKSWGHCVIAAGSGDEAVERLSTSLIRPDLLICDYRLRGEENGIAVIERLRSEYNEAIPAVLITGDTAPGRLAEAEASGLLLLHKPVPNGKLRAAIANLTKFAGRQGAEGAESSPVK